MCLTFSPNLTAPSPGILRRCSDGKSVATQLHSQSVLSRTIVAAFTTFCGDSWTIGFHYFDSIMNNFTSWCLKTCVLLLPRWPSVWQEPSDPQHIWWEKTGPKVDLGDPVIWWALTLQRVSSAVALTACYCSSARALSLVMQLRCGTHTAEVGPVGGFVQTLHSFVVFWL